MILDNFLLLADTVETTTAAASTSYVDTKAGGDANVGDWFVVKTEATAFTNKNGAPQAVFQLQTGDLTTFLDGVTLAQSAALLAADLTANTIVWKVRIPPGAKRYLRGYFTISNYAAGSIDFDTASYSMFVVKDADINALTA